MKLPNADTDSVISLQFQFTLQKNSTFILSKADIRNPLRYLLITECCFAAYQEWLAPLLIQAIEAGDLLDSVKKITAIITSPTRLKNLPAATPEA